MPASSFPEYARSVQDILDAAVAAGEATLVRIEIEPRSALRGFIGGAVAFADASELHFREFIDTTTDEPRLMYAYHYQDSAKAMVFRYDNAAHRPPLSATEHKHVPGKVHFSPPPRLDQILDEILRHLP